MGDQGNVIGFYLDWFIEMIVSIVADVAIFISVSFYVGICLYINGMMKDIKLHLMDIDRVSTKDLKWSLYAPLIDLHNEATG